MLKKLLLLIVVVLLLVISVVSAGWYGIRWYSEQPVLAAEKTEFVIQRGDSLGRIVRRLTDAKQIRFPGLFELLARMRGVTTDIHAGDYQILPSMTYGELLAMFVEGGVTQYNVTLVEGLTLKEILAELGQQEKLSEVGQLSTISDHITAVVQGAGKSSNLEGQFYGDTYRFEAGDTALSILQRAHKRLNQVLMEEWRQRDKNLPYKTPYEALIMASIIEKETGVPAERPDIAGVFARRLRKNMRLQTDPTVIYGLGDRFQGGLNRRMLREATPYNTYVIRGLPPTPIATVGREAIHAALHPAQGKALYFVARGDGTHYFSETLAEHNRAVRKYQITERRKDYRSTVQTLPQDSVE